MTPRQEFPRTECACAICQVGCRTMPGCLAPGDLELIAEHQGRAVDDWGWVASNFRNSTGARVATRIGGEVVVVDVPSIVPAQKPNGECVFYRDKRCSIHDASPSGCALIDTHMDADGEQRSKAIIAAQMNGHMAGDLFSRTAFRLAQAGLVAPPVQQRRAAFAAEERILRAIHGDSRQKPRKPLEMEA